MKKNLLLSLIVSISLFGFLACSSDDDTPDLRFYKTDYSLMTEIGSAIYIQSGSGKYTITLADDDLIAASYVKPVKAEPYVGNDAHIMISAKSQKTGKTTLKVEDEETGQVVVLNVTVTKTYFPISIIDHKADVSGIDGTELEAVKADILKNAPAQKDERIVLVKDEPNTMYIMNKDMDKELHKGTYNITEEEGSTFLTLAYKKDGKDMLHNIALKSGQGKNILIHYLLSNWNNVSKKNMVVDSTMEMTENMEVLYKESHPDLSSASLSILARIESGNDMPVELVK